MARGSLIQEPTRSPLVLPHLMILYRAEMDMEIERPGKYCSEDRENTSRISTQPLRLVV